jgi:hypothetical protein
MPSFSLHCQQKFHLRLVTTWKDNRLIRHMLIKYSVHLYLQLFVGGPMSYLPYLCLYVYCGVHYILCCVFLPLLLLPLRFIQHVNGFKKLRKFESTKGVIRSRQSKKDRQQNDQKQIRQKMIYKTLHSKLKIE